MTTYPITAPATSEITSASGTRAFQIAWGLALCFYFVEYAARSAPAVMIPQLSLAFGTTAVGVSAILGAYYYTYSLTSLIAGAALDRVGAKRAVPIGLFILAVGCGLSALCPVKRDGRLRREVAARRWLGLCFYRRCLSRHARFLGTLAGHRHWGHTVSRDAGRFGRSVRGRTSARTRSCVASRLAFAGRGKSRDWCIAVCNRSYRNRPASREYRLGVGVGSLPGRISKPAVVSVRRSGGTPFCAHDHRRHDMGCRLLSA